MSDPQFRFSARLVLHGKSVLSVHSEMYLKTVFELTEHNRVARVRDIAERLSVTAGTASGALKALAKKGLIEHDRYGYVTLTEGGEAVGRCISQRHVVIQAYLSDVLGLDEETAMVDACRMEHAVSPATIQAMGQKIRKLPGHKGDPPIGDCSRCIARGQCLAEERYLEDS